MSASLFVDGALSETKTFTSITSFGNITTAVNGAIGALGSGSYIGYGKLSGALDDFRFWKTERTPEQIGRNYFREVGGGTNNYIDNAALGIYYKFNEGITGTSSVDSTILDYSGRLTNATFTGYNTNTRDTQSALVASGKAAREFKDPILYANHPDYISSLKTLVDRGKSHDKDNTAAIYSTIPSWIKRRDGIDTSLLKELTQILASYFDTAYLQIKSLPTLKNVEYNDFFNDTMHQSGSKPPPFMYKALESAGFLTPELFADARVLERITSQDDFRKFEAELEDVKNYIYRNIYNNLTHIYKTKGTEKSFRNLFRCFGIDDEVIRLNIYGRNSEFVIENSPRYTSKREAFVRFPVNYEGTVYQQSGSNAQARSSIATAYETMPFTAEVDLMVPEQMDTNSVYHVDSGILTSSIFGFYEPSGETSTSYATGSPVADIQVHIEKPTSGGKDGKFVLKSATGLFTAISSDTIVDLYDNQKWTLAVSVKPIDYPFTDTVSGSRDPATYVLDFYGVHYVQDELIDSFSVTGTINAPEGRALLLNKKKFYAGAKRTNYTGSIIHRSDVLVSSVRYWQSLLSHEEINNHAIYSSYGQNKVYEQPYVFENSGSVLDVPKFKTLSLHWDFDNLNNNGVTDGTGKITVVDFSSGSNSLTNKDYGYIGNVVNRSHPGQGFGFPAATDITDYRYINIAEKNDIEQVFSSNMINVENFDLENYRRDYKPQELLFAIEKSVYDVVSSEILGFFGTITDFNNLIGDPVNKYRQEYKSLEKLRDLFFSRVKNTPSVEKFVEYYKWFDSAISVIITNLKPATANMVDDLRTIIESHVLERSKYWHKFPTLEMKAQDPFPSLRGVNELLYDWEHGHAPVPTAFAKTTIVVTDSGGVQHGDTFTLVDHRGLSTVYTVNGGTAQASGGGNSGTAVVGFSGVGGGSAGKVKAANAIAIAINATTDAHYTAVSNGVDTVTVTQGEGGAIGNRTNADSIDGVTVSNFTGGSAAQQTNNCRWWEERAPRVSAELTTGDSKIDAEKETIRRIKITDVSGSTYATRRLSKPYRFGVERGRDLATGNNPTANKLPDLYKGAIEFASENGIAIAKTDIQATASCNDKLIPNKKNRIFAKADTEGTTGYLDADADLIFPFTIMSSSIDDPFLSVFVGKARITNQHIDSYGLTTEVPLQSPFTEEHVGGQPHRHGNLLKTDSTNRIEAYKLTASAARFELQHTSHESPNNILVTRDGMTKRPVNIKNIRTTTGSVLIGNYNNPYDLVNTAGRFSNNQGFRQDTSTNKTSSVFVSSFDRAKPERDVVKNVFVTRFSAPGEAQTAGDSRGGPGLERDFGEFSPQNSMNTRNALQRETLTLLMTEKSQKSGIRSGSAVTDAYTINAPASYHKVNRNPKYTAILEDPYALSNAGANFVARSDNAFIQHAIPQNDLQYTWITASAKATIKNISRLSA